MKTKIMQIVMSDLCLGSQHELCFIAGVWTTIKSVKINYIVLRSIDDFNTAKGRRYKIYKKDIPLILGDARQDYFRYVNDHSTELDIKLLVATVRYTGGPCISPCTFNYDKERTNCGTVIKNS